jgi:ABC-2 type transport system permease protein
MLQTYGSWVLTAVTREKESRVIEVLLAVIRPKQLLVGKTSGIGSVALAHAAVLIVVAYVTTRIVGADITGGLRAGDLLVGAVWFLLGYALYCSVFAAAGALCARVEDAQAYAFPVMIPLLFAYLVSFSAADGANTLLWVLAFIPPTAVLAMPSLYAIGAASLWTVALSMAITAVAVVVVANVAAKIYERSVLRTARKVRWREAFGARTEIESSTVS